MTIYSQPVPNEKTGKWESIILFGGDNSTPNCAYLPVGKLEGKNKVQVEILIGLRKMRENNEHTTD